MSTKDLSAEVKEFIAEKDFEIIKLRHENAQLRRMIFGAKSERFIPSVDPTQLKLDIEQNASDEQSGQKTIVVESHQRNRKENKNHHGRQGLPASLEREVVRIYPEGFNEESLEKPIGVEVTEILEEIPGKFYVIRIERPKYKTADQSIVIAELPPRPIAKGSFGIKLLVRILIDKYCDHLPLHRQMHRFKRSGVDIPYSTLADVPKQIASLLAPLYNELKKQTLSSKYIQVDETPHPVLDSSVKEKTHSGYLWVYRSVEMRLVLFDYRKGRGREGPKEILKDFSGFLQTDGYVVYDEFESKSGITAVGCMAHARRYFEKSLDNNKALAQYFITEIQKVYAVEREIKENNITGDAIVILRREKSLTVLNVLEQWLKENIITAIPKSPIGTAISYSLSRWKKLTAYIDHPFLEIDNNLVENAIRPTVLGRKNYLFSGSHQGAERSAMMYSFIGSCKINGINPEEWLYDVLLRVAETKITNIQSLLPNAWRKEN